MPLIPIKVMGNVIVPPQAGRDFAPVMVYQTKLPYLSGRRKIAFIEHVDF